MEVVTGGDLDLHLASIGQAQVNAALVSEMMRGAALPEGSRVLFTGAGTGQILDHADLDVLRPHALTFSDINEGFLEMVVERLGRYGLRGETAIDDLEASSLAGPFDAVVTVLVLEQIDWRKGMASILAYRPKALLFVIQQQAQGVATVTLSYQPPPTIRRFAEVAKPEPISRDDLIGYLRSKGFGRIAIHERPVPGQKVMVGISALAG
jgi:hypothetical protein